MSPLALAFAPTGRLASAVRSAARAVRAAMVPPPTSDQVKQRLDAFFASTTATFHTPEGDAVTSMPFRMPSPMTDDAFGRQQAVVVSHQAARLRAEASVGLAGQDGAHVAPGSVSKLTVDASWGNHADPQRGGVARETWLHDDVGGTWFKLAPDQRGILASSSPYEDHSIAGIFRQKGSR